MKKVIPWLRRAFTLVELLVVILVIGILVAMLLPSLSRAPGREGTGPAYCMNNLHQIGLAMIMYSQMNGGYYPYYFNWNCATTSIVTPPKPGQACPTNNWQNATDSLALLYPDLIPTWQTFRCKSTSDSPQITVTVDPNGIPVSKTFGPRPMWSSYGYDRTTTLRRASPLMPVAGDMDGTSVTNPNTVTANHRGGQNILFYDGHVRWMQVNVWDNPAIPAALAPSHGGAGLVDNYYLPDLAPANEQDSPTMEVTHYGDTDSYIQRP